MCDEDGPIIGIDLGTTYSCAAVLVNDQVQVIHCDDGERLMASWVYFSDSGECIVGNDAKSRSIRNITNGVFGVKRLIGRTFSEYKLQQHNITFPYIVENKDERPKVHVYLEDGSKYYAPEEISAMILMKLKDSAEQFLCKKVTKAVVTVPAHFNDAQRQATKTAGRLAGLEVLRILNEPTAAALAYELRNKYENKECNILVYDFGGGTFDVSIIAIEEGVLDVKATNGEPYLGGDNIDANLTEYIIAQFNKKFKVDARKIQKAVRRFQQKAENAKKKLSTSMSFTLDIDNLSDGKDFSTIITRAQFEQINMKEFLKTIKCVEKTLKDAKMKITDIDEIILVGGSSRIPKIREMVKKLFNNKDINVSLHADEAVAIGAARQAAILNSSSSENVRSILLSDVCSLSMGINVEGGRMSVIIPRNSKIPINYKKLYQTTNDNQTKVNIIIFEGEREMTADNKKLGEFILSGLKPAPRGKVQFAINFDVDADGILHVSAETTDGKVKSNITVQSIKEHLSEKDILIMLAEAEKFREEDRKLKAIVEAKIFLQNYCYDTKSKIEEFDGNESEKDYILSKFDEVLEWLSEIEMKHLSINEINIKMIEMQKICYSYM